MTPEQKLAAIVSILADAAPASTPTVPWHRSPGAPWTAGETAFDNVPRAKELAAQGIRADGTVGLREPDLTTALNLCDFLVADTTTADQADAALNGAGSLDDDTARYALLTGWAQRFPGGLGGAPGLFIRNKRIADMVKPLVGSGGVKPGPGVG